MINIKPLYIHVPGQACATPCAYCMTRSYTLRPSSCLDENSPRYVLCKQDFYKRMAFARDDGCNAIFIVGDCEPQKNRAFLERITIINNMLPRPFRIVELTTTGRNLTREYLYFLRSVIGVTTIDLNVAAFDDVMNQELAGMMSSETKVELLPLIHNIKDLTFNLHLHIFLSKYFEVYKDNPMQFFKDCEYKYNAQYISIHDTPAPNDWLKSRAGSLQMQENIKAYIKKHGAYKAEFPSYADVYTLNNLIILMDPPIERQATKREGLIIQTNGRLYTQWDEKTSLVF